MMRKSHFFGYFMSWSEMIDIKSLILLGCRWVFQWRPSRLNLGDHSYVDALGGRLRDCLNWVELTGNCKFLLGFRVNNYLLFNFFFLLWFLFIFLNFLLSFQFLFLLIVSLQLLILFLFLFLIIHLLFFFLFEQSIRLVVLLLHLAHFLRRMERILVLFFRIRSAFFFGLFVFGVSFLIVRTVPDEGHRLGLKSVLFF